MGLREAAKTGWEAKIGVIVDVKDESSPIPMIFSIGQNHPNPFNRNTIIEYTLPRRCQVQLGIYNILGQRVRTLLNLEQDAGYYTASWDSKDNNDQEVASGVYFYRIKAGDFVKAKKMLLLK